MICTPNTGCPVLGVHIKTAATFCLSGLWQGLPYNGFLAAVAPAFPISSPFYIAPLCSSGADRAAGSLRSAMDGRLPLVALRAFPPDLSMGMRCDVCGRKRCVFYGIPLLCQFRINGGKVVAAGLDRFPSAIGAPCSRGAVIYRGLPGMSLPAVSPEFLFAAVAYGFRGQRRIPFIPLSQQLCISRMDAAVIEQFSHVG